MKCYQPHFEFLQFPKQQKLLFHFQEYQQQNTEFSL